MFGRSGSSASICLLLYFIISLSWKTEKKTRQGKAGFLRQPRRGALIT
ncbi:hypothetical protein HOLDEFILI_04144 [Holdemania filiformis DSM 12042]|uniref:Uncharacterized protein n=1 Tax=Holdemania filiformis DSM 12042 TaxID=545696 RepID=B9YE70_9FIRM|nr:hypothetical protein HOLDEFILI_04144 [Holdemania filiformis DSM 12042]